MAGRREDPMPVSHATTRAMTRVLTRVLTRAAARELDRAATEEFGVPSIVLMENAAIGAAGHLFDLAAERGAGAVLGVCGPGNNGGDGFAVIRHAANAGLRAACIAVFEGEGAADAAINRRICEKMGVPIVRVVDPGDDAAEAGVLETAATLAGVDAAALIIVDALFGTGLSRPAAGAAAGAIRAINRLRQMGAAVLSLDIPSGLDAESGEAFEPTVTADRTVTFAAAKPGMLALPAQEYIGELCVAGIGAPESLVERLATAVTPHRDTDPGDTAVRRAVAPASTERFGRRDGSMRSGAESGTDRANGHGQAAG